jgi:DNA-binding beta-propeller fold protein YncE
MVGVIEEHAPGGAYSIRGSDEFEENLALLSRGTPVKYDTDLSCATRSAFISRIQELVGDMIDESIAEAKGTWQTPHVRSIATDASDNLYLLVDPGTLKHRTVDIRKIAPAGNTTRLAAPILQSIDHSTFTIDRMGHPVVALYFDVYDVEPGADPDGVPWYGSHANRIAFTPSIGRVQLHAPIDSIAGDASNHFYATSGPDIVQFTLAGDLASFASIPQRNNSRTPHQPSYVAATPDGTLFVSNPSANAIFKVTPEKTVILLAGTLSKSGTTDGPGAEARFNSPKGLAVDRNGMIYVADSGNQTIRRISPDGRVSTFAGKPGKRGTVDGQGAAARLDLPSSIAIDSSGTLYVVNGEDNRIRKISPEGVVGTMNAQQFIDTP